MTIFYKNYFKNSPYKGDVLIDRQNLTVHLMVSPFWFFLGPPITIDPSDVTTYDTLLVIWRGKCNRVIILLLKVPLQTFE